MSEHGEWNRKGATLSEDTARAEYGVNRDFIVQGIQDGKLEYREGAIWGNPFLRILRSQLEQYVIEQFGSRYFDEQKAKTELRAINKEIGSLKKKLAALNARKAEIEAAIGQ